MSKRALGQNFLLDPKILSRIIDAAGVGPGDTVLEVGPGTGRLTRMLAERAGRLVAIEVDEKLYNKTLEALGDEFPNARVVLGDALKFPYETLEPFKVVANIPYNITTPIIFKLLEFKDKISSMTLTVQKEVAERIAAPPGSKTYGVLSLGVQYHGAATVKFTVPRGAFRPVPRVDSACIHIEIHKIPPVNVPDETLFFKIIRTSFSQRRKTILNGLKSITPDVKSVLEAAGIDPKRRPETLSMQEFARLSEEIRKVE